MSILVTGYEKVKKGKTGYRGQAPVMTIEDIPSEIVDYLLNNGFGFDTPESILEFMQGARDRGFKLIRVEG